MFDNGGFFVDEVNIPSIKPELERIKLELLRIIDDPKVGDSQFLLELLKTPIRSDDCLNSENYVGGTIKINL